MSSRSYKYPVLLIIIILISVIFITIEYAKPIADGDVWFHMAYGRYMIEHFTLVPNHSIYSWTTSDNSQIYCAWIPEILFYGLYTLGGLPLLFILRYMFLFVFMTATFLYMKEKNALFIPLAWLVALFGVLMSQAAIHIKPQIFSFLFMTIIVWAWSIVRSQHKYGWIYCYVIPFVMLIWVNSHGGFIFGIVFLILVTIGEIANFLFYPNDRLDPRTIRHLTISILISICATVITPYGWEYPAQLFHDLVLASKSQMRELVTVREYQSILHPQARAHHFIEYFIISLLISLTLLWPRFKAKKFDWAIILPNIGLGLLYIKFIRTTYFWGIFFVFSSISLLGHPDVREYLNNMKLKRYLSIFVIIICIVMASYTVYETLTKDKMGFYISYYSPVQEAEYIRTHLSHYLLGNDYNCGAYLLWKLWPEQKVFMDARYFPYKKWYHEYATFVYGKDKNYKDEFLSRYKCDIWCATYDFPQLKYFMESPEWRLLYYGPSCCIFARKSLNLSYGTGRFDRSEYHARPSQTLKIMDFAITVGDIENAVYLAGLLKKSLVSSAFNKQISLYTIKLADVLGRNGQTERSIFFFEKALSVSPIHEPAVYNSLGVAYLKNGKVNKAIENYQNSLRLQSDYVPALNNMAIVHSRKGELDQSLAFLKRLTEIQPDNPDNYYNISCILARLHKTNDAVNQLDIAILKGFDNWELLKTDPDLYNIRGTSYYKNVTHGK